MEGREGRREDEYGVFGKRSLRKKYIIFNDKFPI